MQAVAKWPRRKGYGSVKRKVLRWRLKLSNDDEYLIRRGISFHVWGEAEEKARRPNSVLVLGRHCVFRLFDVRESVCASLCAFQTLLKEYLEKCWTNFHRTFSIDAFWDKDEHFKFWDQQVKVQGYSGVQHAGKCTFCLLNMMPWSEFHQTYAVDAFWDKDDRFSIWGQKVKVIELVAECQVLISSCCYILQCIWGQNV